jgi:hypothetical protein
MANQPPTGWVNVPYNDLNVAACAQLLANSSDFVASAQHRGPTTNNLNALLKRTYNEALAAQAGLPTAQPLFYLYYCPVTVQSPICVAFYKTIKRGATSTSQGGTAKYHRWCITVGVARQPANGWSYSYVKSICTYFYWTIRNDAFGDILVAAEDANRQMMPGNYEVDACFAKLQGDTSVSQTSPTGYQEPEDGYDPWTQCLKQGNKINFTQLSL